MYWMFTDETNPGPTQDDVFATRMAVGHRFIQYLEILKRQSSSDRHIALAGSLSKLGSGSNV